MYANAGGLGLVAVNPGRVTEDSGLGFAIFGIPIAVNTLVGAAANLIGGGAGITPSIKASVDNAYNKAIAGDTGWAAMLACWGGDQSAKAAVQAAGLWAPTDTTCGFGHPQDRAYAAQKFLDYKRRVEEGNIGTTMVADSNLPQQALQTVKDYGPWVLGGLGLVAVLALARGARRR